MPVIPNMFQCCINSHTSSTQQQNPSLNSLDAQHKWIPLCDFTLWCYQWVYSVRDERDRDAWTLNAQPWCASFVLLVWFATASLSGFVDTNTEPWWCIITAHDFKYNQLNQLHRNENKNKLVGGSTKLTGWMIWICCSWRGVLQLVWCQRNPHGQQMWRWGAGCRLQRRFDGEISNHRHMMKWGPPTMTLSDPCEEFVPTYAWLTCIMSFLVTSEEQRNHKGCLCWLQSTWLMKERVLYAFEPTAWVRLRPRTTVHPRTYHFSYLQK